MHFAEHATREERLEGEDVGREAQLEVERHDEPLLARDGRQVLGVREIDAQRLLQQHGASIGQAPQHIGLRFRGHRHVVDGVLALAQLLERGAGVGDAEIARQLARDGLVLVVHRGHLHADPLVGRQVRDARDGSSSHQADGHGRLGRRPALG